MAVALSINKNSFIGISTSNPEVTLDVNGKTISRKGDVTLIRE
jgi:hypothetical protein